MGILICGLNGVGKSTLGRALAEQLGYEFIDNEDLFFPSNNLDYKYTNPRSKEEVICLLERRIQANHQFVFTAVKGDYGEQFIHLLEQIILVEAPKQLRSERVRERSKQKYGDRILPGGDLYEKEKQFFSMADNRAEDTITEWLQTVQCPVIRVDGTLAIEKNIEYLLSILKN